MLFVVVESDISASEFVIRPRRPHVLTLRADVEEGLPHSVSTVIKTSRNSAGTHHPGLGSSLLGLKEHGIFVAALCAEFGRVGELYVPEVVST